MKLYTVQYTPDKELGVLPPHTVWCASIADATKAYDQAEKLGGVIRIVTLPKGREEMATWLNERRVKV